MAETSATRTARTAGRIQSSPFLPSLPAIALGDLGRVQFPPVSSQGIITDADRDPRNPANRQPVYGPTTYTKPPTPQRIGGKWRARILG